MFIRVKTTPNSPRKSVQIVETSREGDRVRQRIVVHVGIANDDNELIRLKECAAFMLAQYLEDHQPSLFSPEDTAKLIIDSRNKMDEAQKLNVDLKDLREESRVTTGIHDVYGAVYEQLDFNHLLGARRKASATVLFDMVMARLAKPMSKLGSAAMLARDFGTEIDVNQIYRMMDHLDDSAIKQITDKASLAAKTLLNNKVDVIFYDCTTLYFESFTEDDLRQKGFSKDHKTAETQVILALMVTREGLPIGYRLYPGATWEGDTLKKALEDLSQSMDIQRLVFVADSGLLSKANLTLLQEAQVPFIVAARLKNLPKALSAKILDKNNYHPLSEHGGSYLEIDHEGRRLIVTHSELRARKDAHDRQKLVERIKKRYDHCSVKKTISGKKSKFLEVQGNSRLILKEQAIAEDAKWDGLHGVFCSHSDIPITDIIEQYKGLWQVEETFRLSKHDLKIRPIFHWTERRIKAHIALCFMALTCMRWLEYQCKLRYLSLSPETIRNELAHVQVSVLKDKNTLKKYGMPSRTSHHAKKLYNLVGKKLSAIPFEIKA